jgi:hypothetical protein
MQEKSRQVDVPLVAGHMSGSRKLGQRLMGAPDLLERLSGVDTARANAAPCQRDVPPWHVIRDIRTMQRLEKP